jgi:dihydroorotase
MTQATRLLLRGGRIVDPVESIDAIEDLLIEDGVVRLRDRDLASHGAVVIDADGLVVSPGFVDIHCHLRDPGYEYKETIATGTSAAARGGFTTLCCMPNTDPPIDTRATVEYVKRVAAQDGVVRVLPIGCVTRRRAGRELAELAELADAGCVAFSDDGNPVVDSGTIRRALEYARISGSVIIEHCEDTELSAGGVMHEGWVSTRLGLRGQPAAAEESIVARDIALAAELGAPVHIAHVSSRGSVELVRAAKERGVPVTAEVSPHHLTLTHEAVAFSERFGETLAYDTNAKVNPPLRTEDDVAACVEALQTGVIDCIATDHAPHALYEKDVEFDDAPFGISGLETALGLCMTLVESGALDLATLIERLTINPVRAFGLDRTVPGLGTLAVGAPGDVTVLDTGAEWKVEPERFASLGKNTPLAGRTLKGKVLATVAAGHVVWRDKGTSGG